MVGGRMMLLEPLFVVAVAALLWRRALATQRWGPAWRPAVAGLVVAALAIGSVVALGGAGRRARFCRPFPGSGFARSCARRLSNW